MRRALRHVVLAAAVLVCACGIFEPSDALLRATWQQHRGVLEELRRMFEEDVERYDLSVVFAPGHLPNIGAVKLREAAECREGRSRAACIGPERREAYGTRLERAGIRRIWREETPGVYFLVHQRAVGGWHTIRYRGLVYAPGAPRVTHDHGDTEERVDLGDGWYSYLMIDD